MPYIYSVAWKVTDEHYTMMRGLAMDFSSDKKVLNIDGEYLFGPAFLVAPVTAEMYHPRCMAVAIPAEDLLNSNDEKGGLIGEYFKGTRFDKSSVTRTDKSIYFNWAKNFLPEVGEKNFSVRWTGKLLTKESGEHEFETTTAGGVRVWINNVLLIDKWYHSASQTDVGVINLEGATKYDMKIEFYDEIGTTSFRFTWRTPSMIAHKKPQNKVQSTKVYLPQSADWFDFWTGQKLTAGKAVEKMTPLDIMPLYIKTGSIVPMGPELQHSAEKPADPIEVRIYSGANGGFNLYEDEGDNYNYEKGTYSVIPLSWDENTKTLTMGRRKGKFPGMLEARTFEIVLVEKDHGVGVKRTASPDKAVKYTGGELKIRLGHNGGQ
jgi:alpha-D-xyloside xylohydrolase